MPRFEVVYIFGRAESTYAIRDTVSGQYVAWGIKSREVSDLETMLLNSDADAGLFVQVPA